MAMTHEQIDEQMVDFLYGELPADARAAFEAHVAGCERCRREVESFGQVRAVARKVMDEAPPARVHDAILRAAREAAAAGPAQAGAAAAEVAARNAPGPAKMGIKVEPARASLWDWLRGRWAFPTLATVGALTVFILGSRLFLNPNTTRTMGRPAVEVEQAAAPAAREVETTPKMAQDFARRALPASPRPQAVGDTAAATAPAESSGSMGALSRHKSAKKSAKGAGAPSAAPAAPSRLAAKSAVSDDGLSGPANAKSSVGIEDPLADLLGPTPKPAKKSASKGEKSDELLEGLSSGGAAKDKAVGSDRSDLQDRPLAAEKPAANRPEPELAKRLPRREMSDADEEAPARKRERLAPAPPAAAPRGYAQPPPPAAPAPAPAAAAAAAAEPSPPPVMAQENSPSDEALEAPEPRSVRRKAPGAPASAGKNKRASDDAAESEASAEVVRETLAQRADRLFAQGRWAEAAIAYRDLLRQHPKSPDAEHWRRRLAAARAAVTTDRPPTPAR